jgi:acetyl esterase/lipase
MEMKNETLESNAATDALISRRALKMFRESWIGDTGVARNDPRVNMLHADLSGLPPIMVYYGAYEMLAGEAIEFAKRAKDSGVDVTVHSLPKGQQAFRARSSVAVTSSAFMVVHSFQAMMPSTPNSRSTLTATPWLTRQSAANRSARQIPCEQGNLQGS